MPIGRSTAGPLPCAGGACARMVLTQPSPAAVAMAVTQITS